MFSLRNRLPSFKLHRKRGTLCEWLCSGEGRWGSRRFVGDSKSLPSQLISSFSWWASWEFGWSRFPGECRHFRGPRRHARSERCGRDLVTCGSWFLLWAELGKFYLLLGSGPVERALGNDFGGRDSFGFEIGNFVALGETSAAKRFPLRVLFDHHLAVCLGNLFLNDGLVQICLLFGLSSLCHSKYILHTRHRGAYPEDPGVSKQPLKHLKVHRLKGS